MALCNSECRMIGHTRSDSQSTHSATTVFAVSHMQRTCWNEVGHRTQIPYECLLLCGFRIYTSWKRRSCISCSQKDVCRLTGAWICISLETVLWSFTLQWLTKSSQLEHQSSFSNENKKSSHNNLHECLSDNNMQAADSIWMSLTFWFSDLHKFKKNILYFVFAKRCVD